MVFLPVPSALSPEGLAMVRTCKPTKNYFFVSYIILGFLWMQALLIFRARCFGGPPLKWES